MKKRLLLLLILLTNMTGCSTSNSTKPNSSNIEEPTQEIDHHNPEIERIYALYVKNMQDNGDIPQSYEEWLSSIKGEKGDTGDRGPKGEQGVSITNISKINTSGLVDTYQITFSDGSFTTFEITNGALGEEGHSPIISIGNNGNWWVDDEDTGKSAQGPKGDTPYIKEGYWWIGENNTGIQAEGKDGIDGKTPYIKDGNWWIGDTDTNISVKGDKGDDGVSIVNVTIGDDGHLYVTLSNNDTPIDAGLLKEIHPHEMVLKEKTIVEATCSKYGLDVIYCETCDEVIRTLIIPPTGHTFEDQFSKDDQYHWRDSLCEHDLVADKDFHQFGAGGICSVCGYVLDHVDLFSFEKIYKKEAYEITEYLGNNKDIVSIPSTFENLPVTTLPDFLFENNTSIKTVILPEYLAEIPDWLFSNCTNLKSVVIPEGITSIHEYAFSNCYSLTSIDIPSSVKRIDSHAFELCKSLISVTIPNGVQVIPASGFYNCESLKSVSIPATVNKIEENAFQACGKLEEIKFDGTINQWEAISKDNTSFNSTARIKVVCSNGTIYLNS